MQSVYMERVMRDLQRFNASRLVDSASVFHNLVEGLNKNETYVPFGQSSRPNSRSQFKCKQFKSDDEPDLKSIVVLMQKDASGDIEEDFVSSGENWLDFGTISNMIIELDGTLTIIENGNKHSIKRGDAATTAPGERVHIVEFASLVQQYSDADLDRILAHESIGGQFEFHELLTRYNIGNFGGLIKAIDSRMSAGDVERVLTFEDDKSREGLTRAFMANVCGEFTPLVYHKFQVPLIDDLFRSHSELDGLKQDVLNSRLYSFAQVKQRFLDGNTMSDDDKATFLVSLRKIISGADRVVYTGQAKAYWHPHWFDDTFAVEWKGKLAAMAGRIVAEHFPLVSNTGRNGFRESLIDQAIVTKKLGDVHSDLDHLFKLPLINYVVRDPIMRWDHVNPSFFYDGVMMMEGRSNVSDFEHFDAMGLKPRYVAYSIAIHPIQLLCADRYGWVELVMQTLHHELVHVLQMRFVANKMAGYYLKNPTMKKNPSIKRNLGYLDALRGKMDVDAVLELIDAANEKLYIREAVPQEDTKRMNLEEYVNGRGGHTDAFMAVVRAFKYCKVAWKQRRAFLEFIQAFCHRTTGENFNDGLIFLCKD